MWNSGYEEKWKKKFSSFILIAMSRETDTTQRMRFIHAQAELDHMIHLNDEITKWSEGREDDLKSIDHRIVESNELNQHMTRAEGEQLQYDAARIIVGSVVTGGAIDAFGKVIDTAANSQPHLLHFLQNLGK
jgi:hypothetical protein